MEIIEDRHGKRSTIIASQLPVSVWHEVIGEQTIADAILDRMVHNSLRVDLKGESLRKKNTISEKKTKNEKITPLFLYYRNYFLTVFLDPYLHWSLSPEFTRTRYLFI